jgi:hypothetical protein
MQRKQNLTKTSDMTDAGYSTALFRFFVHLFLAVLGFELTASRLSHSTSSNSTVLNGRK